MKWTKLLLFYLVGTSFLLLSCDINEGKSKKEHSVLIASVNRHNLYIEDMIKQMPYFDNKDDSTNISNAFLEDWIVSQLLFDKAIKQHANQNEIERMVSNYRKELYVYDFEQKLIETSNQTPITNQEIKRFYENFQNQDLLSEDIYKVKLIIFDDNTEKLYRFERGWKKNDETTINEYRPQAHFFQFDTVNWISKTKLLNILPKGFPEEKLNKTGFKKSKVEGHYCYVQIIKLNKKGDAPPLAYIQTKIEKILLYQRQRDFLKRYKEDLYKEAMRLKNVEIF